MDALAGSLKLNTQYRLILDTGCWIPGKKMLPGNEPGIQYRASSNQRSRPVKRRDFNKNKT